MSKARTIGWLFVVVQFLMVFIILAAAPLENSFFNRHPVQALRYLSYAVLFLSAALFLWSLMDFRQGVSPNPVPSQRAVLRTNGIYSRIRHPMYSSLIFMNFGYSLYFHAFLTFIICIILFVFFCFKINFEEKHLSAKFPEYSEYRRKTKKLIPFLY